jgi:hypothetical protein
MPNNQLVGKKNDGAIRVEFNVACCSDGYHIQDNTKKMFLSFFPVSTLYPSPHHPLALIPPAHLQHHAAQPHAGGGDDQRHGSSRGLVKHIHDNKKDDYSF